MEKIFAKVRTKLIARCDYARTGQVLQVFVVPAQIRAAATALRDAGFFLEDVLALDVTQGYVVTYHYDNMLNPGRITLRTLVPHDAPDVPSIADIVSGADWHERETRDMTGIQFTGHPNFLPLLVPAEDPDQFPLRKTAKTRKPLGEMLELGEVVSSDGELDPLFLREEAGAEAETAQAGE
ncbi:MAG: NADH-quinone oxidoreductase subunit C [Desulfovibrionaceae bacterium]